MLTRRAAAGCAGLSHAARQQSESGERLVSNEDAGMRLHGAHSNAVVQKRDGVLAGCRCRQACTQGWRKTLSVAAVIIADVIVAAIIITAAAVIIAVVVAAVVVIARLAAAVAAARRAARTDCGTLDCQDNHQLVALVVVQGPILAFENVCVPCCVGAGCLGAVGAA